MNVVTIEHTINIKEIGIFLSANAAEKEVEIAGNMDHRIPDGEQDESYPVTVMLKSTTAPTISRQDGTEIFSYDILVVKIKDKNANLNQDNIVGRAMWLLMFVYIPITIKVINRALQFFKYQLKNPVQESLTQSQILLMDGALFNPKWIDEDGDVVLISEKPLRSGSFQLMIGLPIQINDTFGSTLFTNEKIGSLLNFVFHPMSISLSDQILSEAQGSAISGNIRRAVVELAISIEVYVKNSFLKREKIAGSAYEYLEDKGRESIKVLDLIDGASLYAFGNSFKLQHKEHFKNIDFIMRCRNKIAHRGETKFRSDTDWIEPNFEMLKAWWISALTLMQWLENNIKQTSSS